MLCGKVSAEPEVIGTFIQNLRTTVADSTEATEQLTVQLEQLEDQQALLLDEIEVQSDEISGENKVL